MQDCWDNDDDDSVVLGRGSRQRKEVDYGDALSEKEWLKAIGASLEEGGEEEDDDEDLTPTPSTSSNTSSGRPRKKRGRTSKKNKSRFDDDDEEEEVPRKRGRPRLSDTYGGSAKSNVPLKLRNKMKKLMDVVVQYDDA